MNFSWILEVLEMFIILNNMDQFISELGISPVGSGLQLKSRDEELVYWGSVVGLHTWNKKKKNRKIRVYVIDKTFLKDWHKQISIFSFIKIQIYCLA